VWSVDAVRDVAPPREREMTIDIFAGDTLTDDFAAKNPARSTRCSRRMTAVISRSRTRRPRAVSGEREPRRRRLRLRLRLTSLIAGRARRRSGLEVA
jgi:hypothetical protein